MSNTVHILIYSAEDDPVVHVYENMEQATYGAIVQILDNLAFIEDEEVERELLDMIDSEEYEEAIDRYCRYYWGRECWTPVTLNIFEQTVVTGQAEEVAKLKLHAAAAYAKRWTEDEEDDDELEETDDDE